MLTNLYRNLNKELSPFKKYVIHIKESIRSMDCFLLSQPLQISQSVLFLKEQEDKSEIAVDLSEVYAEHIENSPARESPPRVTELY